jgi:nitrogen fixation/metabolism regulation signal transduction histidine kinase
MSKTEPAPRHKRRLRNYLLDVGLQLRYTVFIIGVAVFLTAILGSRIYVANQETTRIVTMTASVDPATARELQQQFLANDRIVIGAIAGFGVVLVLAVFAVGIWMTHKIAGPLHNIAQVCARIRDNKLPEDLRHLRKGDELQEFHAGFREMYDALRARGVRDKAALERTIAAIEGQTGRSAELEAVLGELRQLLADKVQSLEAKAD